MRLTRWDLVSIKRFIRHGQSHGQCFELTPWTPADQQTHAHSNDDTQSTEPQVGNPVKLIQTFTEMYDKKVIGAILNYRNSTSTVYRKTNIHVLKFLQRYVCLFELVISGCYDVMSCGGVRIAAQCGSWKTEVEGQGHVFAYQTPHRKSKPEQTANQRPLTNESTS